MFTSYSVDVPPTTPSRPCPPEEPRNAFSLSSHQGSVFRVRKRRRRVRRPLDRFRDASSSIALRQSACSQDVSTQTEITNGNFGPFGATEHIPGTQTTLSDSFYVLQGQTPLIRQCPLPKNPIRASALLPSATLANDPHQESLSNRLPFETCSIFSASEPYEPALCSDFVKIIRSVLPGPSRPDVMKTLVFDLEDTLHSSISDELDKPLYPARRTSSLDSSSTGNHSLIHLSPARTMPQVISPA